MDESSFDLSEIMEMLINPYYALVFDDAWFKLVPVPDLKDEEAWITLNSQLISHIGPRAWLEELVDLLIDKPSHKTAHPGINPYGIVNLSFELQGGHLPLIDPGQWVEANIELMDELEQDFWLKRFIDVLENGGAFHTL